ncbi:MAG: LolA-related protein [Burkholderiaceae bacterium]
MKYIFVLVGVAVSALCLNSASAADIDMKSLMQQFAASKNTKAEFTERKYVRILDSPVESSGDLTFQAPDRLEKRTKLPRAETMLIEGNKVSIERGSFKRSMMLDEFVDMSSLVKSLTATFRGDQEGIEKYFAWTLSGPVNKWQLVLRPKSSKLFITLREIRFAGEGSYVHTVETTLTDGDWSLMTLSRPVRSVTE